MLYRTHYDKPDGRSLWLYGSRPLAPIDPQAIPIPDPTPVAINTHMRWHPVMGEWVIYAAHRQDRTFMPPADSNPLAPTVDRLRPTELPPGDYQVAVFENRFPSLAADPGRPPEIAGIETVPARGRTEVVVFSQDAGTSLGHLPVSQIELILAVWADRTEEMAARGVRYVLPFENRGVEMGVTLSHPHSQIYGYGFVPDRQARIAERFARYAAERGTDMVIDMARREMDLELRAICVRPRALGFVPACARFPFETWITPLRPVSRLAMLGDEERRDMAIVMVDVLRRLDALFGGPMPYLMTVNQAPTDGADHPGWSVRIEIWPIRRSAGKLKYLAGTELGAGVFASDVTPEQAASQLRDVGP